MRKEDIDTILEAAVRAPSGENCQPWRFVVQGASLSLYNLPERDLSPYNFHQFGSLVSHGAVIENIAIAASVRGYRMETKLFPRPDDPDCTAVMTFAEDANIAKDELYESIFRRASNRTAYDPAHVIDDAEKEDLIRRAMGGGIPARVALVGDAAQKKSIALALSYGDRLLFENRFVHDFLFGHIYWNLDMQAPQKSGFYIKELALTPPQEFIFKLLKRESMRRFFARIGLPSLAAKDNASLYEHSSMLGAIIARERSPKDFIEAGRLMERIWLVASKEGYDMQLLTAIPFFYQRVAGAEAEVFSEHQIAEITASYKTIAMAFGAENETIVIVFRIGKGKPLPHRSPRLEPMIEYR